MYKALLIVGPTGSGKTPLGEYLEQVGFRGRSCHHFDFGTNLRRAVDNGFPENSISEPDRSFIAALLKENALLENDRFYIAKNILHAFARSRNIVTDDFLVLNGLPRHTDQARNLAEMVDITTLIYLETSAGVVRDRVALNSGGDRTGRQDDGNDDIENKLEIFTERTWPLLNHFRKLGADIRTVPVLLKTRPADILPLL